MASETPRIAFAPSLPLFEVPSRSIIVRSRAVCSAALAPWSASAISLLTWETAFPTAFPPYSSPPSRSSTASYSPVEAPDGTAASPRAPDSSATSTSTVGFPRESSTCRPWIDSIVFTEARKLPAGGRAMRSGCVGEPPARLAQGELGIDAQAASRRHGLQQQRADHLLGLGARGRIGLRATGLVLSGRPLGVDSAQHLPGIEEGRQVLRQLGGLTAPAFHLSLDLLPLGKHLAGGLQLPVAVDVRMAADQLRRT